MSQDLRKIGEKGLLQLLHRYLDKSKRIVRSFSEDCAVIEMDGEKYYLLTVDIMIENVHFCREYMPAFFIGRKGLKVGLSDISAMGGSPLYYLVSLAAPKKTPVRMIEEMYEGMASVSQEAKVAFLGGNLSSGSHLILDIMVIGEVSRDEVLYRNGAREGDIIFVTGKLGAAAEGLKLLQDGFRLLGENGKSLVFPDRQRDSSFVHEAILAHLDPPLYAGQARRLAESNLLHSMVDLSDGLASDLTEICNESKVGAIVEQSKLPVAPSVLYWERKRRLDPYLLALEGGEDYHLLFTAAPRHKKKLREVAKENKISLFEIGKILPVEEGIWFLDEKGKKKTLGEGYDHFRKG